jgi:hypothetical protein
MVWRKTPESWDYCQAERLAKLAESIAVRHLHLIAAAKTSPAQNGPAIKMVLTVLALILTVSLF